MKFTPLAVIVAAAAASSAQALDCPAGYVSCNCYCDAGDTVVGAFGCNCAKGHPLPVSEQPACCAGGLNDLWCAKKGTDSTTKPLCTNTTTSVRLSSFVLGIDWYRCQ